MPICPPVRRTFSDERSSGTFHSLGDLPKRRHDRKPPVFHIPHDHDDDADHPSSPPPVPADVPFPRSPSPPAPVSPPPQLSRGSSNPILLSNGKPLKPSLKSSSSSPAMVTAPQSQHLHLRSRSAPSSPAITPKNVHFPEKDYALATVCVFDRSARPASLSSPANGDETETEGEETPPARFPFPLTPHVFSYEIDPARSSFVPSQSPSANLLLESLTISSPSSSAKPVLSGSILVENLAFEKSVAVRFTLDDWQTVSEVSARYVVSLSGLPSSVSPPTSPYSKRSRGWDRFTFTIRLEDYAHSLSTRTLWLAIHYHVNSTYPELGSDEYGPGGDWWDNNGGMNYRVGFRPAVPSPSSRAKPRRETISAPIPPPRIYARAPPTTREHPLNATVPSVQSTPKNDGDLHVQRFRAGKLNLCNYSPPTIRVTPSIPFPSAGSPLSPSPSSITKPDQGNSQVSMHDDTPSSSTLSTPSSSPTIAPRVIIGGQPATPSHPHNSSKENDGHGHVTDWDWSAPSKLREEGFCRHHADLPPSLERNGVSDSKSLYNAFVTQWCFAHGSSPSHSVYGDVGIMT